MNDVGKYRDNNGCLPLPWQYIQLKKCESLNAVLYFSRLEKVLSNFINTWQDTPF
jgi:hypothetical protein